jgi:hypothetical protein
MEQSSGQGGATLSNSNQLQAAIETFLLLFSHRPHNLFVIDKLVECFRQVAAHTHTQHPHKCKGCFGISHIVPSWSPSHASSTEEQSESTLTVCAALCSACPPHAPLVATLNITQKRRLQLLPEGTLHWEKKKSGKAFCSVAGCDNEFNIFLSQRVVTGELTTGEHHCRFCGKLDFVFKFCLDWYFCLA